MKQYKGIDISLYQTVDWAKVKADKVDFVMIKASQGRMPSYNAPFTDPKLESHIKGAASVGLPIGVYHYYCARNTAEVRQEAEYFVNVLKPYKDKIKLWAAVDVEDEGYLGNLLFNDRTKHIKSFCDIVKAAGFRPMVYANTNWLTNYFTAPADVPIWEANWGIKSAPARAKVWQYSSSGKVNGISGNVDVNYGYNIFTGTGDVNGDGVVNLTDVTDTMKQIAGWGNKIDTSAADVNGDGKVTLADVTEMMKQIADTRESKYYTVQPGDSLWGIADKMLGNGSRYTEIASLNGLTNASVIHPGDKLMLPKK